MRRGTHRFGVECALQRSFAGLAVVFAAVWATAVLSPAFTAAPQIPITQGAAALFVAFLAAAALRGWRTSLSGRFDAPLAAAAALAVHAAFAVERPEELVIGIRVMPTVAAVLLAVGFLGGRTGWSLAVGVLAAQVLAGRPADGAFGALEGVWPAVASAVAASALAPVLRRAGHRADTAEREELQAAAVAARSRAQRRAQRAFERLLHDEVGVALHAAAHPGVPVEELRAQALRAVTGLTAAPAEPATDATADLAAVLAGADLAGIVATASVASGAGPGPRVAVDLPAGGVALPAEVAAAFLRAASEALRNAGRYADATRVEVRLRGGARGTDLTVSDDGRGFDPGRVRPASTGLRRSVHQCLADVGGVAEVTSAPGRGTTVRLRREPAAPALPLPGDPRRPRRTADVLRAAIGDVRRPLAAVCLPFLGVMGWVAAVHAPRTPGMVWFLPWYGLLAAATCLLLSRADRGIGGRAAGAALALAVAGAVGSLLVMPPEGLRDYTSWPVGAVTPLLTLLVTVRPAREVLLALACEEAGLIAVTAARPPVGSTAGEAVLGALPAMIAPVMGVVMGALIGRTVTRLGGAVLTAREARTAVVAAESAARARRAEHSRRLGDLDELVLPFLRRLAFDPDGADRGDRHGQARRLGESLRDEMHLSGVLDRRLRALIGAARTAGCRVTVHAFAPEEPEEAQEPEEPEDAQEVQEAQESQEPERRPAPKGQDGGGSSGRGGPASAPGAVGSPAPARPELVRRMLTAALAGLRPPSELVLSIEYAARPPGVSLLARPGDPQRAAALRAVLAGEYAEVTDTAGHTSAEVVLVPAPPGPGGAPVTPGRGR